MVCQERLKKFNGVFTPEQDKDKTNVEPVHSYDAFHTVVAGPSVKGLPVEPFHPSNLDVTITGKVGTSSMSRSKQCVRV